MEQEKGGRCAHKVGPLYHHQLLPFLWCQEMERSRSTCTMPKKKKLDLSLFVAVARLFSL